MTTYVQANTDGHLHDATIPSISPLNRGFLYGDAVYEVWRTYHGTLFAFAEHWRRLQRSAAALRLELPFTSEQLAAEIRRTIQAFREHQRGEVEDWYVRLQVTRGGGPIGLDPALADRASWVLLVQPLPVRAPGAGRAGLRLSVARELRRNPPTALNPAWKTGNYLNNLLCLREARSRGADEVIILNEHGEVSEAAVGNIFFVRDEELVTPPLSAGILAGVTRELILHEIAQRAGLRRREAPVRPADFGAFTECFLSSTTRDVAPVAEIDDQSYAIGAETVTGRLKNAFAQYTAEYARRHPELRM